MKKLQKTGSTVNAIFSKPIKTFSYKCVTTILKQLNKL